MIAALLHNTTPIIVEGTTKDATGTRYAVCRTIAKSEMIGQAYEGGVGYVSSRFATLPAEYLSAAVAIDPEDCEPLANWLDAMAATDDMADDHHPDTYVAMMKEDAARKAFVEYLKAQGKRK